MPEAELNNQVGASRSLPAGLPDPGHVGRDVGQSTPFRPMGGCSPPKVVTLGVERPPKLLTNPHFSPGAQRSEAGEDFFAMRLKPSPMLDSWCPARLCGDGCFPLAEHASQTSLKTITFLLKAAPLLGLRRIQT